ncbi:MAG TPA: sugar phosphate isomerase/epimerase family protein [Bryobacteraceae bacterium]|nr:sugar phosphate isomerase/epimerase family protein [Bryobacteraceae bacterium]
MNRRTMLTTLAAMPAASLLRGQIAPPSTPLSHLKPGLVAYSYRTALAAKKMTYDDVIHMASDWGLAGVDTTVYWLDTSPQNLAKLRRTAFKAGIQLYNAGARIRLAQPTKEKQDAEVAEIKKWVDVADAIGASHVRVFGGPIPKGATQEQAIGWAVEVLKRGAEYSGTKGIILGVEDDGGLSATAPPTIAIAKGADTPWAGINADSGNLPKNGYTEFPTMLPYATSIHFKTMVSDENGKKIPADWPRLLAMIAKSGYRGFVGLEYEGNNPDEIPERCAKLRDLTAKATS